MAAGTLARRWASVVATPIAVLAIGAGLGLAGAHVPSPSGSVLAQGCYQAPTTPGLYNPPDYSNCGSGPYIKPQGWPAPKPKQSAPK
jgi:hypothetical protein